jgi:hypothetical protein
MLAALFRHLGDGNSVVVAFHNRTAHGTLDRRGIGCRCCTFFGSGSVGLRKLAPPRAI